MSGQLIQCLATKRIDIADDSLGERLDFQNELFRNQLVEPLASAALNGRR